MKNVKSLSIALLILLITTSCASTISTRELLIADGKNMGKKLPYLENLNRNITGTNDIRENSSLYTIWERELREHVLDNRTDKRGSIEIVEIYRGGKPNFMKTRHGLELEFEIRIYNLDERLIWDKSYYRETSYSLPFFSPNVNREDEAYAEISILKSIIEEFKNDIALDYNSIMTRL